MRRAGVVGVEWGFVLAEGYFSFFGGGGCLGFAESLLVSLFLHLIML